MQLASLDNKVNRFGQVGWALLVLLCTFYGGYAFYLGGLELFSLLGWVQDAPERVEPLVFLVHAFAGGLVLITGALQFNLRILRANRALHRALGRVYVGGIWPASAAGLWSALFFDVSLAARLSFGALAVLWFGTTTVATVKARRRQLKEHREWMVRSFALSLFFVTFSFWVPGLTSTSLPEVVSYPLAVSLSWGLNLLIAEVWIWRTRFGLQNTKKNRR